MHRVAKKVIINNRSFCHGCEGSIKDERMNQGIREYLVLFNNQESHWFGDHEVELID